MKAKFIILVNLLLINYCFAQKSIDISLIDPEEEMQISPGEYTVNIKHMVPTVNYKIKVEVSIMPIQFQEPVIPNLATEIKSKLVDPCLKLQNSIEAYSTFLSKSYNERTEFKYVTLTDDIKNNMFGCTTPEVINSANSILSTVNIPRTSSFKLEMGEVVHVTIIRMSEDKKTEDKKWEYIYKTAPKGKFLLTYGFSFSSKSLEPAKYFTSEIGTDSFAITKERAPNVVDCHFLPSIFFNWMPTKKANNDMVTTFVAGLGANADNFAALTGVSFLYNQTVGISTGISWYSQQRLLGMYRADEIVKTNLTEGQLHENVIRPNFYLSIVFRLADNPFGKKNENSF